MAKKPKKVQKAKKSPARKPAAASAARPSGKATSSKEIKETPLTESQISKFRDILTEKREELLTVVQKKKEQDLQMSENEPVGDEADVATRSVEKEMLFELTDSEKQTLDMIEASLRKMEKGVYGRCENCQKTILRLRLEVMPWARYCIQCQAEMEVPSIE
jgi:DnaK suppressor protein